MPMSDTYNLPWVISTVCYIRPQRVLDVGIGTGTYGFLLRQYLDIRHERLARSEWQVQIDGVEIFESYRNPIWECFYDRVFTGDVRELLDSLPDYDAVIMGDVIEHFDKEDGYRLLTSLMRKSRYMIVTTPGYDCPQGSSFDNPHETHRSVWTPADFHEWPHWYLTLYLSIIVVLANDDAELRKLPLDQLPHLTPARPKRNLGDLVEALAGKGARRVLGSVKRRVKVGWRA